MINAECCDGGRVDAASLKIRDLRTYLEVEELSWWFVPSAVVKKITTDM